jgi:hypothetical protein
MGLRPTLVDEGRRDGCENSGAVIPGVFTHSFFNGAVQHPAKSERR